VVSQFESKPMIDVILTRAIALGGTLRNAWTVYSDVGISGTAVVVGGPVNRSDEIGGLRVHRPALPLSG